MMSCASD